MRFTLFFVGFIIFLSSCTQRTICPAYQSAFIHDKNALTAHFSYFNQDSTPKVREVDKSRYLIVEPVSYRKRTREMNTVAMRDVYPVIVDSTEFDQNDLMLAERDVIDSATVQADSAKIHPGLIGPFNTDQELYMYYLRKTLVLPDVRAQNMEEAENMKKQKQEEKKRKKEQEAVEGTKKKKSIFNIFKKEKEEEQEEQPQENLPPMIFDEEQQEKKQEKKEKSSTEKF